MTGVVVVKFGVDMCVMNLFMEEEPVVFIEKKQKTLNKFIYDRKLSYMLGAIYIIFILSSTMV